jgi:hypothetical protein
VGFFDCLTAGDPSMENKSWLIYVALAGLSWGTYVPIVFYGGSELGGKPASRFMAILCVGVAYFVLAVIIPTVLFMTGQQKWSDVNVKPNGLIFASLAGVAGAVGAICVIFATKSAMDAGRATKLLDPTFDPATYKMYIGPLIFGLAPVINTIVSIFWHPKPGNPFHFGFTQPSWKLLVGIVLVGLGAALVLFSKEESEKPGGPPSPTKPAVTKPAATHPADQLPPEPKP